MENKYFGLAALTSAALCTLFLTFANFPAASIFPELTAGALLLSGICLIGFIIARRSAKQKYYHSLSPLGHDH